MGLKDIYRALRGERDRGTSTVHTRELYSVWHGRWPPGFRRDGRPQEHWLIIVEEQADGQFGCLMVNTDRGKFEVAARLGEDQARRAGVSHGAFGAHARCKDVPRDALETWTGELRRDEVLAIEAAVQRLRAKG